MKLQIPKERSQKQSQRKMYYLQRIQSILSADIPLATTKAKIRIKLLAGQPKRTINRNLPALETGLVSYVPWAGPGPTCSWNSSSQELGYAGSRAVTHRQLRQWQQGHTSRAAKNTTVPQTGKVCSPEAGKGQDKDTFKETNKNNQD